jgi:hypothetical protein
MPRPPAHRKCARCKHPWAKHTVNQLGQCTVRVYVSSRGRNWRGQGRLVVCDCPGYLAELPATPILALPDNVRRLPDGR